jgi:hypothetical protein
LDDFYYLQLDKLDRYVCLKPSEIDVTTGDDVSSSADEEGGEDESDGDDKSENKSENSVDIADDASKLNIDTPNIEDDVNSPADHPQELIVEEENVRDFFLTFLHLYIFILLQQDLDIRAKATAFMGVSKNTTRSPEEVISTPLPGETLTMFYSRSRTCFL